MSIATKCTCGFSLTNCFEGCLSKINNIEKKYPIGEVRVYFVFKHPKTGEEMSSKLYTPLELLDTDLSIINERTCVCDCKPVGETNVVECNCEDYYQDFAFHSYHVELHQPPADAETSDLEQKAYAIYEQYCDDEGIKYHMKDAATFCHGYVTSELNKEMKAKGPGWVKASEFKYELEIVYHAKFSDTEKGAGYFNDDGGGGHIFVWQDGADTFQCMFHKLLILDESGEKGARP